MRRISIAIALTILLLTSFGTAQQKTDNASNNSGQSGSPTPPPGPIIGGMGTTNYIPLWAAPTFLLSSVIYQSGGGQVGIGITGNPQATLDVNGNINAATTYNIGGNTVLAVNSNNLAGGVGAGQGGFDNIYLGEDAGRTNSGQFNIFIGPESGYFSGGGENNIAIGYQTGISVNSFGNVMIGSQDGGGLTSGNYNTFIGNNAGPFTGTGSGNTYIGNGAGGGVRSGTETNNILINNPGLSYDTNTIRIGDPGVQTSAYIAGIFGATVLNNGLAVYVDGNGQLGTVVSSQRFKENIRNMGESTDALMKLRPVTFLYKPEYANGERTLQYGLIAEEVAKVYPELVAYDNDGQPYSVRYQYLSTMLLNEVQKQYRRAEAAATVVAAQEQKISELEQRLSRLEALLERGSIPPKLIRSSAESAEHSNALEISAKPLSSFLVRLPHRGRCN